jgi:hypothetical protein
MSRSAFVVLHTIISMTGIGSGLIMLTRLLRGKIDRFWNGLFLLFTILTSASGFLFPHAKITPGIILGILSLLVLVVAVSALYVFGLRRKWRATYIVTAMIALYFNLVVLVLLLFQRVPVLNALTVARSGLPVEIAQLLLFILISALIAASIKRTQSSVA